MAEVCVHDQANSGLE